MNVVFLLVASILTLAMASGQAIAQEDEFLYEQKMGTIMEEILTESPDAGYIARLARLDFPFRKTLTVTSTTEGRLVYEVNNRDEIRGIVWLSEGLLGIVKLDTTATAFNAVLDTLNISTGSRSFYRTLDSIDRDVSNPNINLGTAPHHNSRLTVFTTTVRQWPEGVNWWRYDPDAKALEIIDMPKRTPCFVHGDTIYFTTSKPTRSAVIRGVETFWIELFGGKANIETLAEFDSWRFTETGRWNTDSTSQIQETYQVFIGGREFLLDRGVHSRTADSTTIMLEFGHDRISLDAWSKFVIDEKFYRYPDTASRIRTNVARTPGSLIVGGSDLEARSEPRNYNDLFVRSRIGTIWDRVYRVALPEAPRLDFHLDESSAYPGVLLEFTNVTIPSDSGATYYWSDDGISWEQSHDWSHAFSKQPMNVFLRAEFSDGSRDTLVRTIRGAWPDTSVVFGVNIPGWGEVGPVVSWATLKSDSRLYVDNLSGVPRMFSVTDSSLELRNSSALVDTGCIWVFDDVEYAFTATLDNDLSSELYHVILIERVSLNTFARDTVRKISLARPYANARMTSCYVPAIFNDLTNTICLVFRVRYESDTSQKPYRAELNQGRKLLFDISSLIGTVIRDDDDYFGPSTDGRTFVISRNQSPPYQEILNIDLPPFLSELKVGGLFVDGSTSIDWSFPAALYDIRSGEIQSELPNFPEAISSNSDSRPYIVSQPASRRAVWLDWGNTGWEKLHYGMGGLLYDTKGDSIVHGFHAFGSKRDRMSAKTASDGTYSIVRLTDGQTILVHHPDHVAQLMQWKLHSTSISPNDEHVSSQPPQLPVSIATQSTVPLRVTQNGAWVVTVYDHLGRQEAQGSYETDDGLLEISTSGLPVGIHAIVAKQGGEVSRRMVMIEAP